MCTEILPRFLYYAYIPAMLLSAGFGIFLYQQAKKKIINRLLASVSLIFFIWLSVDFFTWFPVSTGVYLNLQRAEMLIFLILPLLVYFAYFLIKDKIVKIKHLLIWLPLLPIIVLSFSPFYALLYYVVPAEDGSCSIGDGPFYDYIYIIVLVYLGWFISILFKEYRSKKLDENTKNQIRIVLYAISAFILWIIIFIKIQDIFGDDYALFIPFGIVILIGMLTYAIAKYELFDIKLLTAQVLIATLAILVGALYFYIQTLNGVVLITLTLLLLLFFGQILIRSVKKEIQQKEELEVANVEIETRNDKLKFANREITKRKNQLQKMADSLAIANDKLKLLDTAKTDFISMASHQLRTPPTPIKGYSSMLLEGSYGKLTPEQRTAIENIAAANNQQIAFVEDLLAVSRIESGSMKFEFKKVQIGELCQEVVNNLILKAKDKGLYLDYNTPTTPLPELNIDGAKIREVISNLVDNAVKYTKKGGVTILTELCKKKEKNCLAKPHLRVTVSDTGIGVPAEEIPYLFQKFSRGKDITRLNTGGTGLGLYVVKMITQANGGKTWIESPGKDRGSKFILELPLEQLPETIERNG